MESQFDGERRRHTRFKAPEGVFAEIKAGARTVGQVLDVSEGGVALKYLDGARPMPASATLRLFATGGKSHLADVPVRTVSEFAIPNQTSFTGMVVRRLGVEFGELDEARQKQLREFIFASAAP